MPRRRPPPPHANTNLCKSYHQPPPSPPLPHFLQTAILILAQQPTAPIRILTQILTLQLLYYLSTTSLILFTALTAGKPFTPDLVLSWKSLRGDTAVGWTLGLCWMGGSFCG